jgi:hypothetical protein
MSASLNPAAPHDLPAFITAPGETDVLMVVMAVVLVVAVAAIGILFLRIHSLPERMAHKSKKLQLEIVAVLCLLALFTHVHLFWVAALLLALIDIPDFGGSLGRMAGSLEKIAGIAPGKGADDVPDEISAGFAPREEIQPPSAEPDAGLPPRELTQQRKDADVPDQAGAGPPAREPTQPQPRKKPKLAPSGARS